MSEAYRDLGGIPAKAPSRERGTRWPIDQAVPAAWIEYGHEARKKHGLKRINLLLEADKFVSHWGGEGKPMKDWKLTWRRWCLRAWDGQPELEPVVTAQENMRDADALRRVRLALKGYRSLMFDLSDVRVALAKGQITQEEAKKLGI